MTKCVLGDVAKRIQTGPFGSQLHQSDYSLSGTPVVMPKDLSDGTIVDATIARVGPLHVERLARHKLKEGDLLFSRRGDVGRCALVRKEQEGWLCGTGCLRVELDVEKADYKYLYYFLRRDDVAKWLESHAVGAIMLNINPSIVSQLPVVLPSLDAQHNIAKVLSTIDRKIALNRKRIATLEAMAKEIYDYWFVQFDFPDAHGRPYKSSGGAMVYNPDLKREIPKGWGVCRIGDHITANRGISYSTKNISSGNGVPMINLNSFNVDSSYKVKGIKMFDGEIPLTRRISPYDLVMCNTQQTDLDPCKDIIGKSFLVPDIFEGTIVSSHHVTTIHVDDDNLKVYLNALFHTREFHAYIAGYASGTSIRGLNFHGVENCYIAVPHMPLLSRFANLALSCEKEKSRILRNQEMLQTMRDFILPLLMNGQVKVG